MMPHLGSESTLSRYRSPSFSKNEIKTLVELVDKYKTILLNKSTNSAACHAKDLAWSKLTKIYNSNDFEYKRNSDCLKMKWENLKREARKINKNGIEVRDSDFNDLITQVVSMMNIAETYTSEISVPKELEEENDCELEQPKEETVKYSDDDDEDIKSSEMFSGGEKNYKRKKRMRVAPRSTNFTPQECSLLLKCVRAEKKYVFCNENSHAILRMKNHAWARITNAYNKQAPSRRSLNCLRTKFDNMKRLGRKMGFLTRKDSFYDSKTNANQDFSKLADDDLQILEKMKTEPDFDAARDSDDDASSNFGNDDSIDALHSSSDPIPSNISPDPLSVIINSDSGIGIVNNMESTNNSDSEIAKLKLELLHYQMENAKLERKRIEDAARADKAASELRATETALRLRAARLEAEAAAMKIPPGHPALRYSLEERLAEDYLSKC